MTNQLHVSGLNMLSRCGEQFRFRHIEGIKTPPNVSLAIGSAVDESVTRNLTSKIDTGTLLDPAEVKDIARDALTRQWLDVEPNAEDAEEGMESGRDAAVDASVSLAELHHKIAAPTFAPTHVQRSWVLDIQGLPIQLVGTIDIQEGLTSIRDTKTSGKSPNKSTAETSLQLTTYALAVRQHDGAAPEKVVLDYLVRTPKRHDTKLVQLESRRTDADFPHLLERVYQASRVLESGLFTPAPLDAWWCSRTWCGYWDRCKYAARPVSVAS